MKMIVFLTLLCWSTGFSPSAHAAAAGFPTVGSPWAELKKEPLLNSAPISLAPTWGPALPIGTSFAISKAYGRWLYGTPEPLKNMKKKDFAKPGWIYSRLLLVPNDKQTESAQTQTLSREIVYHSHEVWKQLDLDSKEFLQRLDLLESLVLSEKTLQAFSRDLDPLEKKSGFSPWLQWKKLLLSTNEANAEEDKSRDGIGFSGAELNFLDQEFQQVQKTKEKKVQTIRAQILKPPSFGKATAEVKTGIFSRFLLQKYFEMPPLNHEEIDGTIYMRATAERALRGCEPKIQNYWRKNRWRILRVYRLKSRPEERNPWLDMALPGGYFTFSARAIDLASNEAELAFLLVRPFVKEMHIRRKALPFSKNWPKEIPSLSEDLWNSLIHAQSVKYQNALDVADDINIDMQTLRCIAKAGYQSEAGLHYLQKLSGNKDQPWAKWFQEHSPGIDYRLERISTLRTEETANEKMAEGTVTNVRRFSNAAKQWNLLP